MGKWVEEDEDSRGQREEFKNFINHANIGRSREERHISTGYLV